jgi:hypothetical protein
MDQSIGAQNANHNLDPHQPPGEFPVTDVTKNVKNAIDKTAAAAKDATKKAGDAAGSAAKKTGEAVKDAGQKIKNAGK